MLIFAPFSTDSVSLTVVVVPLNATAPVPARVSLLNVLTPFIACAAPLKITFPFEALKPAPEAVLLVQLPFTVKILRPPPGEVKASVDPRFRRRLWQTGALLMVSAIAGWLGALARIVTFVAAVGTPPILQLFGLFQLVSVVPIQVPAERVPPTFNKPDAVDKK